MNIPNPLLLCLLLAVQAFGQNNISQQLQQLSKQHQFAKMDSLNNTVSSREYYFYKGLYANVCNNPKLSNSYLDSLKNSKIKNSYEFVKLKNDNHIKLFQYDLAYKTSRTLTGKFQKHFTEEELDDEINAQRIWQTLSNQPAQSIEKFTTVTLPSVKDKAGLITTSVSAHGTQTDFVFDTGAGISCITESMAEKLGMTMLPDNNIMVESFTGQKNKVRIAMAPEIMLGELKIHHAMFLVYPDTAFTFANGAYVINGIIGFPIVKELGTITLEKDRLTFSKHPETTTSEKNLFTDQLRAIVMLKYKGKMLPFNFDSGAKVSLFNKSFYETFQSGLDRDGILETITSSGAGAAMVTSEVLVVKDQELFLGKKSILLPKMEIDRNDYGVYGNVSFGNIGQDIIGQFKKVIMSFEHNYLRLEN